MSGQELWNTLTPQSVVIGWNEGQDEGIIGFYRGLYRFPNSEKCIYYVQYKLDGEFVVGQFDYYQTAAYATHTPSRTPFEAVWAWNSGSIEAVSGRFAFMQNGDYVIHTAQGVTKKFNHIIKHYFNN